MLRSESSLRLIPGVCMLCTFLYTSKFNKKKEGTHLLVLDASR